MGGGPRSGLSLGLAKEVLNSSRRDRPWGCNSFPGTMEEEACPGEAALS